MSGFTVRELLARIRPMRPDLNDGTLDKITQEVAKRVMRESYLGQVVQTVFPIFKGQNEILLTTDLDFWDYTNGVPNYVDGSLGDAGLDLNKLILPSAWNGSTPDDLTQIDTANTQKAKAEVLRVLRVRMARLPYTTSTNFVEWVVLTPNSATSTIDTVTNNTPGDFWIIYGVGVVTDSYGNTYSVKTGDILQLTGSQTVTQYSLENYATLGQVNAPTVGKYSDRPQMSPNNSLGATQWSQRHGQMGVCLDAISTQPPISPISPSSLPYFVITVSPAINTVPFDGQGNQIDPPYNVSVTITRYNGFAGNIDVVCPLIGHGGDVFEVHADGFGDFTQMTPFIIPNAPDSFSLDFSASSPGQMSLCAAYYQNVALVGISGPQTVYSNYFTVN